MCRIRGFPCCRDRRHHIEIGHSVVGSDIRIPGPPRRRDLCVRSPACSRPPQMIGGRTADCRPPQTHLTIARRGTRTCWTGRGRRNRPRTDLSRISALSCAIYRGNHIKISRSIVDAKIRVSSPRRRRNPCIRSAACRRPLQMIAGRPCCCGPSQPYFGVSRRRRDASRNRRLLHLPMRNYARHQSTQNH